MSFRRPPTLFLTLLLALVLRLNRLELEGLSACEESFNHLLARGSLDEILRICADSNQLPLPIFLRGLWHLFLPWDPWHGRLLSALTGTLFLLPLAALLRRLAPPSRHAAALFLAAVAVSPLLHARLIREYSLLLLLATLSLASFIAWHREGKRRQLITCLLLSTLTLQIHYAAVAFVFALLLATLLFPRAEGKTRRQVTLFLLPFLPLAAWLLYVSQRHGELVQHLYSSAGSYLVESWGLSALKIPWWLLATRDRLTQLHEADLLLLFALVLLAGCSLLRARGRDDEARDERLLLLLFLLPLLLGGAIFNLLGRDDLCKARYFLPQFPVLILLVARNLDRLPRQLHHCWLLLLLACLFLGLERRNIDEEFRTGEAAVRVADALRQERGATLIVEPPLIADLLPALGMSPALSLRQREPFGAFRFQYCFTAAWTTDELLAELENHGPPVYLFYPYFAEDREGNPLHEALAKRFPRFEEIRVGTARIRVYGEGARPAGQSKNPRE